MLKMLFVLAIGVAVGYGYGYKDARQHDQTVVTRILERVGGATRDRVATDADATLREVER
ncbi:MAG TPA: hypothetical protein VHQ45_18105 [Gemmatimonadaceae bacterium]|nr:hypothetical protein [Gemmatimonadaceae bacterium]